MRVLFWQEPFRPQIGGMQTQAEALLPRLHRRGHEVLIITRRDSPELPSETRWQGMVVRRLPFWQVLHAGRIEDIVALRREVTRMKQAFAPDVVHMNGFGPSALFHLESTPANPPPFLLALHSINTLSGTAMTVSRRLLESAGWVTACSHALLDTAREMVPSIRPRSSVVHNGVGVSAVTPVPLPAEPRVLCLGGLAEHKGFDLAIRTLPPLLRRFPTLRLIVAGDGPARGELEQLAAREGVAAAVDFVGAVPHDDVPRLLNGVTILAIPSRREAFGLVALEAALMRRPVVASRVGGLPEVVTHETTGLLVEPDSSRALAAALGTLLASPATCERMGAAGRERALRHFDLDRHVDAYENLYRRIIPTWGARERQGATCT